MGRTRDTTPRIVQRPSRHLEEVRARGADYLLFPSTAFWWLDFYTDFRHHLDSRYRRVLDEPDCIIYRFVPARSE